MKRISFLTVALLVACMSFAQMTRLSETVVESPKFTGSSSWDFNEDLDCSPICQYLQQELEGKSSYDQGVVALLFTVNSDGTISNLTVENSVSESTDKHVVACIQSTSGMWTPGMVNGTPSEMQRKIFIRFNDPTLGSLQEQGNNNIQLAVKKYNAALRFKSSVSLSEHKAAKKANTKLVSAIKLLDTAERYLPSEPSVVFWQAAVYEQIGNDIKKAEKLTEFEDLLDPTYQAQIESVSISL